VGIHPSIGSCFHNTDNNGDGGRGQRPRSLSDIKITRNGPVIIATYSVSVAETIEGKRLTHRPAPRLIVFLKTAHGWQWIAHANLKPLI